MIPQRRIHAALFLTVMTLLPACRSNRSAELLGLVPRLDPEFAQHLAGDDPEDFKRYAAGLDHAKLGRAYLSVREAPPPTTIEEFVRVETALEPYAERLVAALCVDPRIQFERRAHEAYRRRSVSERMKFVVLLEEIDADNTSTARVEDRAAELLRLIERGRPYSDLINLGELYGRYAGLLPQLRRRDEIPQWLKLGLEATRDFGDDGMACQILGTLGIYYKGTGNDVAMRCAWDSALVCARRIDSWQEARILSFWGRYYQFRGQLAIARDLMLEAEGRCHQIGAPEELRFTLDALLFFANLDCWEVVGRGLPLAEIAYADGRRQLTRDEAELEGTRLDVLRAQYAATIGHRSEARRLALRAVNRSAHWPLGPGRSTRIRLEAARALSRSGARDDARRLLKVGLEQCNRVPIPELQDEYAVELAEVELDRGELAAAESLLARYSSPEAKFAVRYATLALRLAMQRGDRDLSFDRLREALRQLAALEATTGGSPEGYIVLAVTEELRRAGHEFVDRSPEAGYGFEMWWRTPAARRTEPAASEADFVAALEVDARRVMAELAAQNAMHCVYDVRDDGIVRFTASGEGIVKERIDYDTDELRAAVQRIRSALSEPASERGPSGSGLHADLHRLASALLPTTENHDSASERRRLAKLLLPEDLLRDGSTTRTLLVTANDCLASLPFGVLDIGARAYAPLLERFDLASLHHWGTNQNASEDSAVVISSPDFPPALRARYPVLNSALPASLLETHEVERCLPRTSSLSGPTADKSHIAARWSRVRLLYFAGHVVVNAELPYLTFIPVAGPRTGGGDEAYLGLTDVRRADLSRCQLVVLSGCSSGVPYSNDRVQVPSLADGFLDAGAHAAINTAWPIADTTGALVMGMFIRSYAAGAEQRPIAALNDVGRRLAAETGDPRTWAAYSITVTGLDGEPTGKATPTLGVKRTTSGRPVALSSLRP